MLGIYQIFFQAHSKIILEKFETFTNPDYADMKHTLKEGEDCAIRIGEESFLIKFQDPMVNSMWT